ncbi:hypothetical protein [Aurantiacibacter marinus]|nr:hypothetical protein [Aurantiacibacter marinus]
MTEDQKRRTWTKPQLVEVDGGNADAIEALTGPGTDGGEMTS